MNTSQHPTRRNLWLTIALVLGAAAIWWAMLSEPEARDAQEPVAVTPVPEPNPPTQAAPAAPPVHTPTSAAPSMPTNNTTTPEPAAPPPEEKIPAPERTGPVEPLKAAFASEPRDSNATAPESAIQAAFRRPEVPSGLLKSVLCRTTVCKVETRWTPERAAGFMGAFMNLVASPEGATSRMFDPDIAISPEGEPDANGERSIDVYLKRI